jgi:hypothetical protein
MTARLISEAPCASPSGQVFEIEAQSTDAVRHVSFRAFSCDFSGVFTEMGKCVVDPYGDAAAGPF